MTENLFAHALAVLEASEIDSKPAMAKRLAADWAAGSLTLQDDAMAVRPIGVAGRPQRPRLVSPPLLGRRRVGTPEGRAALLHALAHIEFNAINLALDAVYRFRGLPRQYYADWIRVGAEEAHHFSLLREHLQAMGFDYGSFTAHNGLWEMAVKTAYDPLVRMALVPRVLEARGLDASPAIIGKLESCGDRRAAEIMQVIQRDEIGHVRIGNHWYRYLCEQRGLEPVATFRRLLRQCGAPRFRPPFAIEARRQAGFTEPELELLDQIAAR